MGYSMDLIIPMAFGIDVNGPDPEARARLDGAIKLATSIATEGRDVSIITCGGYPEVANLCGYKSLAHAGLMYLNLQGIGNGLGDSDGISVSAVALNRKTNTALDLVAVRECISLALGNTIEDRITIVTSRWCALRQWAIACVVFGKVIRVHTVRSVLGARTLRREFLRHEIPGMFAVPKRVRDAKREELVYID